MKKYLVLLLLLIWVIFQTKLFSYSWEKVWDVKCSEINSVKRYQNLSPSIITKIDLIWDKINKKYIDKDNTYKEKIYNIYIKVLNKYLQKNTYSWVQKEVLLRIWDYFVCKKESLKKDEVLDIYNIKISDITEHSVKVSWEWNNEAQTWLYVKRTWKTWPKHDAKNNFYIYPDLWSGYEFTLLIQGKWSNKIKKIDFKTLSTSTGYDDDYNNDDKKYDDKKDYKENKYLEEVNIPKYDKNNPEHFMISSKADWKHINDADKKHFYVKPWDYTSLGHIKLTRSWTKEKQRTISLYNGNDLHPGALEKSQNSRYKLHIKSDRWVIDRQSQYWYNNYNTKINWSHNIINRYYATQRHGYPVLILNDSHYNTIQNSRFEDMITPSDAVWVNIIGWGYDYKEPSGREHYIAFHNKIIRNEFRNQNDGVQFSVTPVEFGPIGTGIHEFANIGGTILDDNDFYIEGLTWDDYLEIENAYDLKTGSPDPKPDAKHDNPKDNPFIPCIISNNRAWGYLGETWEHTWWGGTDPFINSMHANWWIIKNNIAFDSTGGWAWWSNSHANGMHSGMSDSKIYNNITFRCGSRKGNDNRYWPWKMAAMKNTQCYNNYTIEPKAHTIGKIYNNYGNSSFKMKVVDPLNGSFNVIKQDNHKWFEYEVTEVSRNWFRDYIFTYDKFTANPKKMVLPKALPPEINIPEWND